MKIYTIGLREVGETFFTRLEDAGVSAWLMSA